MWTALDDSLCQLGESPFWHPHERSLYWLDIPARRAAHARRHRQPQRRAMAPAHRARLHGAGGERRPGDRVARRHLPCAGMGRRTRGHRARRPRRAHHALQRRQVRRMGPLLGRHHVRGQGPAERRAVLPGCAERPRAGAQAMATRPPRPTASPSRPTARRSTGPTPRPSRARLGLGAPRPTRSRIRRVFRQFEAKPEGWTPESPLRYEGRPDGATLDAEGHYWVAMFEGGRLLRFSPSGEQLEALATPVQCPTMPCFGGDDLRTLYVTSARKGRPADELSSGRLPARCWGCGPKCQACPSISSSTDAEKIERAARAAYHRAHGSSPSPDRRAHPRRRSRLARRCASAAAAARISMASRRRASCWTPPRCRASPATSRASWWSPCAPARRWPSSKRVLAEQGQCLPFEPPHFGGPATVGGMVAAGLSGPARASVGAVRDYVLGVGLLNGKGELLAFGGQVMKNVAGYDVSRADGRLARHAGRARRSQPQGAARGAGRGHAHIRDEARPRRCALLNAWGGQPLPLNASCWVDDAAARAGSIFACAARSPPWLPPAARLGGERQDNAQAQRRLARCARPAPALVRRARRARPVAPVGAADRAGARPAGSSPLIEWHGGQRWYAGIARRTRETARGRAARSGGHATLFIAACGRASPSRAPGRFDALNPPLDRASSTAAADPRIRPPRAAIFDRRTALAPRRLEPMQTELCPRIPGHRRRPGSRGHPAQVRALRLLHRHLPDLPAAGR